MSSAFLWVVIPLALAVGLLFFQRSGNIPHLIALFVSLFLAWAAWQIAIDSVLQLGPLTFEIFPGMSFFGRTLTLGQAESPLLAIFYSWESLWLLGALLAKPARLFTPLSLAAVALLVAAFSVDPFLYAALILAAVVLLLVPLLAPPGSVPARGALRFIKFQLFSVPLILFTGWLLTGVESTPGDTFLVLRVSFLLALGFAFLMAVFPFHSWLPMLGDGTSPYTLGFLGVFLPAMASVFILNFFDRYIWLRTNLQAYQLLLIAGTLNVVMGGVWAAGERHLGRIFAFAVMVSIGSLLQAIGLGGPVSVSTVFALLLPQTFAIWFAALALSVFVKENDDLKLASLHSTFRNHPLLTTGLVAALFSMIGFPLLGSFFAHLSIWRGLALFSPWVLGVSAIGTLGMLIAIIRIVLAWGNTKEAGIDVSTRKELGKTIEPLADFANPYVWSLALLGGLALLGFGLFPQVFLGDLARFGAHFPQLFP